MVPAESMLNLESRPLVLTMFLKIPSAAGLLQMLPRQTKRTEKGLIFGSLSVSEGVEAIVALVELTTMGLLCVNPKILELWTENWSLCSRKGEDEWQNGNFGGVKVATEVQKYKALISFLS